MLFLTPVLEPVTDKRDAIPAASSSHGSATARDTIRNYGTPSTLLVLESTMLTKHRTRYYPDFAKNVSEIAAVGVCDNLVLTSLPDSPSVEQASMDCLPRAEDRADKLL